jgi:hypothetical protein
LSLIYLPEDADDCDDAASDNSQEDLAKELVALAVNAKPDSSPNSGKSFCLPFVKTLHSAFYPSEIPWSTEDCEQDIEDSADPEAEETIDDAMSDEVILDDSLNPEVEGIEEKMASSELEETITTMCSKL